MKRFTICLFSVLFVLGGFCGTAMSGQGGPEDPAACKDLPAPTAGPYLYGTFTAAYDRDQCAVSKPDCKYVQVHVTIFDAKNKKEHLYSFNTLPPNDGKTPPKEVALCSLDAKDLIKQYAQTACAKKIGEAFGYKGVPVLTELKIKTKECADAPAQIINGTVTIRVVPPKQK